MDSLSGYTRKLQGVKIKNGQVCSHPDLLWFHGFWRERVFLQTHRNTGLEAYEAGLGMGLGCASGCEVGAVGQCCLCVDPSSSMSPIVSRSGEEFSRYCKPACHVCTGWLQLTWLLWKLQNGNGDVLPNVTWQPCHEDTQDCEGGKQQWTKGLKSPVCLLRCQIWQAHGWVLVIFMFMQPPFVMQLLTCSKAALLLGTAASSCAQPATRSLLVRNVHEDCLAII